MQAKIIFEIEDQAMEEVVDMAEEAKTLKNKTKEGKKLKKKELEEQEDPGCQPPTPKKRKNQKSGSRPSERPHTTLIQLLCQFVKNVKNVLCTIRHHM